MRIVRVLFLGLLLNFGSSVLANEVPGKEIVKFKNGALSLGGVIYKPKGIGPFPAILYNHGSAPGMLNDHVSDRLGPVFAKKGWVFFMPYRRGQGLSASAGPYVMDEVEAAEKKGGMPAAAATMTRLLKTDHLSDQLAALDWLKKQSFVQPNQVAEFGNSFGGIETVLGTQHGKYCAAIDASGGAMSWDSAPMLQTTMIEAVRNSQVPVFFFQAENDFNLSPSKTLSAEMKKAGKPYELKFYPSFGKAAKDGSDIWGDDVFSFLTKFCQKH